MCNLYKTRPSTAEIARLFGATRITNEAVATELYPKRIGPVVRRDAGELIVDAMTWGFPPPAAARAPVTNVRNLSSPFWRSALAKPDRRCLVPVSEFCEWEGEAGAKVKRWFSLPDRELFALAGVWRPTEGGRAYAFLTCEPNELVAPIHPKAMPVVLREEDHARWLDGAFDNACSLAAAYPAELMRVE